MDMLKRSLAPITDEMWTEIDNQAKRALLATLTARKCVDVIGPKGWNYAAVELGRLEIPEKQPDSEMWYGIHSVQPLVETRAFFKLEIAELDNIVRGAKDIQLDALIEAAQKIALFEEHAIYHGFKEGKIPGLFQSIKQEVIPLSETPGEFLKAVSRGVTALSKAAVGGPHALVIHPETWNEVANATQGFPLQQQVENLLGGMLILCPSIEGALLVSTRGGDFEMVIGHDFAVGYAGHDVQYVKLFLTESFTFRVLEPNALVRLEK
jgi:uncharacterized linocin/CFP29 family protein